MVAPRMMTNRRSIFPLQPAGAPSPKSGVPPRSRTGSVVVSVLPAPEPLSSVVVVPELLELDDDPLDEPSGTVVTGVVVNADESEVGA